MNRILIMISICLLLVACNGTVVNDSDSNRNMDTDIDEYANENDESNEIIQLLQAEIDALESKLDEQQVLLDASMITNSELVAELDDKEDNEHLGLSDFYATLYDSYSVFNVHPFIGRARISIDEPMRITPAEESPTYNMRELAEEENMLIESTIVADTFLTILNGNHMWVLAHIDEIGIGYFSYDTIEFLTDNKSVDYNCNESFVDYKLGMDLEKLFYMHGNNVVLEYDRRVSDFYIAIRDTDEETITNDRNLYYSVVSGESDLETLLSFEYTNERVIDFIMVHSPKIPLKSGYKVGDNSADVFEFYDELYDTLDEYESYYASYYSKIYDIGNGFELGFFISGDKISSIYLWAVGDHEEGDE